MRPRHLAPLAAGLLGLLATAGCSRHTPLGQARYRTNCGICHHGGEGMLGEIPPLTGRIDQIARTPEGRHYLIDVLLNGLNGPLVANGGRYNFSMPSFRRLSDTEIAAILTYLSASGGRADPPTFQAGDVAAQRGATLGPSRVADERQTVDRLHPMP
ncbi:cytochrome c class I [Gluconacetobacter sacchari DSM 12717]|uniref:Cytochrome c n=2 Tax=Gluconacetobacter sacchari TaxID=92759 RepID=A0A7W4IFB5_9PROT|nr:cytochrome c [Gluconacetobacter sacchari]MBB2161752.1 cytochrome c [Gluconacetobacter sacchari]GBQ29561.1 cytochrome c class I [Gluconacetobacter sacchari DSM 12717]